MKRDGLVVHDAEFAELGDAAHHAREAAKQHAGSLGEAFGDDDIYLVLTTQRR